MKDSLDLLLREALKQKVKEQSIKELNKKLEKIANEAHSAYNNEANWRFTRFLQLRCSDEQGNEVILGNFREYIYRSTTTRKLCRDESPVAYSPDIEYVTGNYWIHLDVADPPVQDEESQIRIRHYLKRNEDIPLKPTLQDLSAEYLLEELMKF